MTDPAAHGWTEVGSLRREIEFRADVNREHIEAIEAQIALLVDVSKERTAERAAILQAQLDGIRRELAMMVEAQKEATLKQEAATERRFESVNEWRAQSADRERSMREQTLLLTNSFMPREVADATSEALRKEVAVLRGRLDLYVGQSAGAKEQVADHRLSTGQLFQGMLVVGAFVAILVNLLIHVH